MEAIGRARYHLWAVLSESPRQLWRQSMDGMVCRESAYPVWTMATEWIARTDSTEDGIHRFECSKVEQVKEAITYSVPEDAEKCSRAQFVKLRNRIFGNPNYASNPTYYIKPTEIQSMTVMDGTVILGSVPIDMKPAKFQPLDY